MGTFSDSMNRMISDITRDVGERHHLVLVKLLERKGDVVRHRVRTELQSVSRKVLSQIPLEDKPFLATLQTEKLSKVGKKIYEESQRISNLADSLVFEAKEGNIIVSTKEVKTALSLHYGNSLVPLVNLFAHIARWWQDEANKEGIEVTVTSSPELQVSID